MAYSKLGIVNLALGRIGVGRITSGELTTPVSQQSLDVAAVWEYILDEVLEARNWRFAKTRAILGKTDMEIPTDAWLYAYPLPVGFLKFAYGAKDDPPIYPSESPYIVETVQIPEGAEKITNGSFTGAATGWTLGATYWAYAANQVSKVVGGVTTLSQAAVSMVTVPVAGESYLLTYEIVAIADGYLTPTLGATLGTPVNTIGVKHEIITAIDATGLTFTPSVAALTCTIDNASILKVSDRLCLLTNYDNSSVDLVINFIKRITDPTKFSPSFINALAFRLAAELAIQRTESLQKFGGMMQLYGQTLTTADELNKSLDYLEDEKGNNDIERAGR